MSISSFLDSPIEEVPDLLIGIIKDLRLRIRLEVDFMHAKNYNYFQIITPKAMGCDLRELVFNQSSDRTRKTLLRELSTIKMTKTIPHILTDIDDTIFPNFNGIFETMGSDLSWQNHQTYPGLKKFYQLFYKNIPNKEVHYSTVLTGTPAFLKGRRINDQKIKDAIGDRFGFIQGFDTKRQAIFSLLKGMYEKPFYKIAPSSEDLATIKFHRFKQYKQLFPEYRLLFIGDNGQGDLIAGQKILNEDASSLVFIHNLLKTDGFVFSEDEVRELSANRLYFFNNYLELGNIFYILGFITATDFNELRISIKKELVNSNLTDKNSSHFFHYRNTVKLKRI